ncbi:MAG TPA: 6-phosphofructokinase [Ilumatobacteraceae bacterium]|nr:6-phosphofructokinase [Ilumatobacteraceae bacterium]
MRVGILTSGGDAPGMNACIRAVVRAAEGRGWEAIGIRHGFAGLLLGDLYPLDRAGIVNIVHRGGTILGTSRSPRMHDPDGRQEAISVLSAAGIDGMVLIGGDGTFHAAALMEAEGGPPTVGIPGTIDNDIVGTEVTLGFDTAVNTALESIDRIRDTATSHERLFFVEVMGRDCGAIALTSAIAGGAEALLVPEIETSDDDLAVHIEASFTAGKRAAIVVVAEGARPGGTSEVARYIADKLGLDCRVTILGHVQRGGSPSAADRILGAVMGVEAIAALAEGEHGVFIGYRGGAPVRVPYNVGDGTRVELDATLGRVAEVLEG